MKNIIYFILDEKNKKLFEEIHNSFFVLSIDHDHLQRDSKQDERSFAAGQLLHGNKMFTSNRFFDKTIQVKIIFEVFIKLNKF
jgi:hypothetical protein